MHRGVSTQQAVGKAPQKEAAKAQGVLAPPLAKAAMEPAPDVREAAMQVSNRCRDSNRFLRGRNADSAGPPSQRAAWHVSS